VEVAAVVALGVLFCIVPTVICAMKDKWAFAIFCFIGAWLGVGTVLGIVGSFRLAKPGSWWARRFYSNDPEKLNRSNERFPEVALRMNPTWRSAQPANAFLYEPPPPPNPQDSEWDGDFEDADPITRRALRKQGGL